jgi:hypothetical protein
MKVDGKAVPSQSFKLVKDPRSKATQADLDAQFAFLIKVRDETSKANDAVKLIRNVRSQISERAAKLPADKRSAFESGAKTLETTLSAAEKEIYQTQNRSGQDPLNYPIRLNNKIAALAGVASGADARPTNQTLEVYRILSAQLDVQLSRIRTALSQSLPALNRELATSGLPAIVESTEDIKAPGATEPPGADDEENEAERGER